MCTVCGEVIEKGEFIEKLNQDYKDGQCTVCGATDPDYKPDTDSPETEYNSNILLWAALAFVSSGLLGVVSDKAEAK